MFFTRTLRSQLSMTMKYLLRWRQYPWTEQTWPVSPTCWCIPCPGSGVCWTCGMCGRPGQTRGSWWPCDGSLARWWMVDMPSMSQSIMNMSWEFPMFWTWSKQQLLYQRCGWLTAHQLLLHTTAGLRTGQTVLVLAGGSGVGTAAVQLVSLADASAFVTAGQVWSWLYVAVTKTKMFTGSDSKVETEVKLGASGGCNYNW